MSLRTDRSYSLTSYLTALTVICFTGCKNGIEVKLKESDSRFAAVSSNATRVARPGEQVKISGSGFDAKRSYVARFTKDDGSAIDAELTVESSSEAYFVMPDGLNLGEKSYEIMQGSKRLRIMTVFADQASNTLPFITADPSEICSTVAFIDRLGARVEGTKNCTGLSTTDNEKLLPGNIKSGITIAGVAGLYPSSTYPLTGATVTADLDTPTFNAKIKSGPAFEYWDSNGVKHTGAGDSDIVDSNIANTIDIFGTTGNLVGGAAPDPWDLRAGVTVGAVTGRLKVNCRNRSRAAVYNYDEVIFPGTPRSISNNAETAGTAIDYWDTIDDYNNNASGLPTSIVGNLTNNDCSGVETVAGDNNVWKDITTAGSGAASCSGSPENCTMQDKITGLGWSRMANFSFINSTTTSGSPLVTLSSTAGLVPNMRLTGTGIPASANILSVDSSTQITMSANATASASNVTVTINSALWNGAVNYCDALTHNGFSDWRLPTQKELIDSYNHGIRSAASSQWISESNMATNNFWSASSVSDTTVNAWYVFLAYGYTDTSVKTGYYFVACVR